MRARDSARQTVLLVRGHLNFGRIVGVEGSVRLFRMLEEIRSFVARGKDVLPNVALWPPASQIPPLNSGIVPEIRRGGSKLSCTSLDPEISANSMCVVTEVSLYAL